MNILWNGFSLCLLFVAAPDGKEVEVQLIGGGELEAEHSPDTPLSPCCNPSCSCVCHLQRPGMKLIWVPVNAVDGGEEGSGAEQSDVEEEPTPEVGEDWEHKDAHLGGESDSEGGDKVDCISLNDEKKTLKQERTDFHQSLNVLLAEGHRRLSDPGPHTILTSLVATRSQSPPVPPKRGQLPPVHPASQNDDDIYELTLPEIDSICKKATPQPKDQLDIPQIKIKVARRTKLSSTSEYTSELNSTETVSNPIDVPPAIPPRMPITADSRSLLLEEQPSLAPSGSITGGLSPQRAISSPPGSPLVPHRAPPPPPKTDPRRLSTASVQSLTQKKGLY